MEDTMPGTQMERRRSLFPDVMDWFGTGFPRFPMCPMATRPGPNPCNRGA